MAAIISSGHSDKKGGAVLESSLNDRQVKPGAGSGNEPIPKIIHFCWFGGAEKPKKVVKCMASWRKHLSGYTWMEWNESNFDFSVSRYAREAYEARKFAFVSDYARLHALYRYGGVYLDTDVEALRPLDDLLKHSAFSGFEDERYLQSGTMGAAPGHPWIKELLDDYKGRPFVKEDGSYDMRTNTAVISEICTRSGLVLNGREQSLPSGVVFYPRTYFSPFDPVNGGSYLSDNSYTIHHFSQSWLPAHVRLRSRLKRGVSRIVGPDMIARMRKLLPR
jgi:hypothetical protein